MQMTQSTLIWFLIVVLVMGGGFVGAQEASHGKKAGFWDHIETTYGQELKVPSQGGIVAIKSTNQQENPSGQTLGRFHDPTLPTAWHVTTDFGANFEAAGDELVSDGFLYTYKIRAASIYSVLYALVATGEIVKVFFVGTMDTGIEEGVDAADAHFELSDFSRERFWTVTGEDLGWSGQGKFGPTKSDVTHIFDGPLESEDDIFTYWETTNSSPGVGMPGSAVQSGGHFHVTVKHPSPVALMAGYAADGPGPYGAYTLVRSYSYNQFPDFAVDYIYEEELGYFAQQFGQECYRGEHNNTNFYIGIFNLTGKDVSACQFQGSWNQEPYPCTQDILDVLNHPNSDNSLLIRTEDYVFVPSPDCTEFTPTTRHIMPGEIHWMWVEFVIGGSTYTRKIRFIKR